MHAKPFTLLAPISGPIVPLEQVPDPVFAQKMVGDGISIDPTSSQLMAPCSGTVIQLHRAKHAVTLASASGVQVLMHIGIDTVGLKGAGFVAHVKEGDTVVAGDVLLSFDMDFIATKATSLLTQIVVVSGEQVTAMACEQGLARAGQTPLLTITANNAGALQAANSSRIKATAATRVLNAQGLHARPCALLAECAKKYTANIYIQKTEAQQNSQGANIKSVIAVMALELERGDSVTLVAEGDDAEAAVAALTQLMAEGLGEKCSPLSNDSQIKTSLQTSIPLSGQLIGVCASPGLAVGQAWQLIKLKHEIAEQGLSVTEETELFALAIKKASAELLELVSLAKSKEQAEIFNAHLQLMTDPELLEQTEKTISQGKSAAWSWQSAYQSHAAQLSALKNKMLAARAVDMHDVGVRILDVLTGAKENTQELPEDCILIADELTPTDTAKLDPRRVLGFCTVGGGASSHVAIIARSLNIPALAGVDPSILHIQNGVRIMLRADKGCVDIDPKQADVDALIRERVAEEILNEAALTMTHEAAQTLCGKDIDVAANIGKISDAEKASSQWGADGVGLLRSEFLFMERTSPPNEEEQTKAYSDIASRFNPAQKIIIRTLDVGGDKPLSYLPLPKEENPFLGVRGLRVSLQQQALFRTQLRAILRASKSGNIHVMFPMVSTLEDLRQAKEILEEERLALGVSPIPVGIMVEVPSVAMMASQFAREVDFFSIGTNDLTQYTLAVDRGHPRLAKTADPLNPAVLAMIASTVEGAKKHNIWVGVCGGMASDPLMVPILIGLGVTELSCSMPSLPRIKASVRDQNIVDCQALAKKALLASTAQEVRALLRNHKPH